MPAQMTSSQAFGRHFKPSAPPPSEILTSESLSRPPSPMQGHVVQPSVRTSEDPDHSDHSSRRKCISPPTSSSCSTKFTSTSTPTPTSTTLISISSRVLPLAGFESISPSSSIMSDANTTTALPFNTSTPSPPGLPPGSCPALNSLLDYFSITRIPPNLTTAYIPGTNASTPMVICCAPNPVRIGIGVTNDARCLNGRVGCRGTTMPKRGVRMRIRM